MSVHRPPVVLWENVPELMEAAGGSNLNYFSEAVVTMGYELAVRIWNAADYWMPQARRRCFGVCVHADQAGLGRSDAKMMCESIMQLAGSLGDRSHVLSLDEILLDEDDSYLANEYARLLLAKEKGLEATEAEDMTWRSVFLDMCRRKAGPRRSLS
jgi:site-specific DNA-cytosine methylase